MHLKTLVLAIVTASLAAASPVLAPPAPPCTSFGTGPPTNISIAFATWTAPGFFCETTDKIYSNFAEAGIPGDTVLNLQEQSLGPLDLHVVTFSSNFLLPFTVSYDIAVDLILQPLNRIVRVSGDLSNPSAIGNPTTLKTVFEEGGLNLGTLVSSANGPPATPLTVSETALHVVYAYAPMGGAAVSISNTFAEAQVPELIPALLVASGILSLLLLRKRHAL